AFLFGASLTRDSVRRLQQERLKETLDNLEQEINQSAARAAAQALSPDAAAAARAQYEAQRALLARLRQAQPQGRIVLGLAPDARDVGALPELPLEDGDRLVVPVKPVLVNVMGTVYNQNAFIYKPKADIGDYLAQAGGPTRDGDKGSLYVIRADGSVVSNRQRGWFSGLEGEPALPGDTVVVPLQTQRVAWLRELRDITQIVMQIATTALIAVRL
ncbi:MAG: sugar ABC transporter substrate-binding protein, partial [Pseudomonadota bacterium]